MVSYNTKQKKLVLDIIKKNPDKQFSCDEITFLLMQQGTPVGKTTVYRQLEKLVSDGKLKKLNAPNSKSFIYQYLDEESNCDKHMHLRCSVCGKYEHLGCDFMSRVNEHILMHHDFRVDNSNTEIVGICGNCAAERTGVN